MALDESVIQIGSLIQESTQVEDDTGSVVYPATEWTLESVKNTIEQMNFQAGSLVTTAAQEVSVGSINVTFPRYRPRFAYDQSDNTLGGSYETLFDIDFDGKLDGINLNFDRDDVRVKITVDGTVIFEEALDDLSSDSDYSLNQGGDEDGGIVKFPLSMYESGKQFNLDYRGASPDVLTNLTVEAKRYGTTSTTKFKGGIIVYREKI